MHAQWLLALGIWGCLSSICLMANYLQKFAATLLDFPLSHFVLTLSERPISSERFHRGCGVRGPLPHWWASYVISVFQPLGAHGWWIVHSEHKLCRMCSCIGTYFNLRSMFYTHRFVLIRFGKHLKMSFKFLKGNLENMSKQWMVTLKCMEKNPLLLSYFGFYQWC